MAWRLTCAYSRIVGAALGVIMAIIIVHHMAIIRTQYRAPQLIGVMAPMPEDPATCWCGNNAIVVMSHALIPSPAPAAMYTQVSAHSTNSPTTVTAPSRLSRRSSGGTARLRRERHRDC